MGHLPPVATAPDPGDLGQAPEFPQPVSRGLPYDEVVIGAGGGPSIPRQGNRIPLSLEVRTVEWGDHANRRLAWRYDVGRGAVRRGPHHGTVGLVPNLGRELAHERR